MKISAGSRSFSSLIFIIFLLIVFLLFIIVNNTLISVSPGSRVWVDFMFLLVIVLGLAMFYQAYKKNTADMNSSDKRSLFSEPNTEKQVTDEKVSRVTEEVKDIDLKDILPQKEQSIEKYAEELLRNMANDFKIVQGLFYFKQPDSDIFHCRAQFAYYSEKDPADFKVGEGLSGQAIKNRKIVSLTNLPENYFTVVSGLGKGVPSEIVFLPIANEKDVIGLIEYATFATFNQKIEKNLSVIADHVAGVLVKISKK